MQTPDYEQQELSKELESKQRDIKPNKTLQIWKSISQRARIYFIIILITLFLAWQKSIITKQQALIILAIIILFIIFFSGEPLKTRLTFRELNLRLFEEITWHMQHPYSNYSYFFPQGKLTLNSSCKIDKQDFNDTSRSCGFSIEDENGLISYYVAEQDLVFGDISLIRPLRKLYDVNEDKRDTIFLQTNDIIKYRELNNVLRRY